MGLISGLAQDAKNGEITMRIKGISLCALSACCVIAGMAAASPSSAGTDCIPASHVRKFAADHNFKLRELSKAGLKRALAYWKNNPSSDQTVKAAFGYYLHTSEYQVKQNGKVVAWKPMDAGLITMYTADKTCFGYTEGTQQQAEDILSDSAGSLKGAFK